MRHLCCHFSLLLSFQMSQHSQLNFVNLCLSTLLLPFQFQNGWAEGSRKYLSLRNIWMCIKLAIKKNPADQWGRPVAPLRWEKFTQEWGAVSIVFGVNAKSEQLGLEGKTGQCKTGREILAGKKWSCRHPMHHP